MPGNWTRGVEPLISAFGGSLISPKGTYGGYMNSPQTASALEFYQRMYSNGSAPTLQILNSFPGVDFFQTSKVAMYITGIWTESMYKETPKLTFGTVTLPKGPVSSANTICYSGWGVSSKSKNQPQAFDFVKYLTGVQGETFISRHTLATMPAVADKANQDKNPYFSAFLNGVSSIKPIPDLRSPYWNNAGNPQIQDLLWKISLNDKLDIPKALNTASKKEDQQSNQARDQ